MSNDRDEEQRRREASCNAMSREIPDPGSHDADINLNELSDRLTAYDEQLRCGSVPNLDETLKAFTAVDPEASALFNCLHFLERAWPRFSAAEGMAIPTTIGRFQIDRVLGVGGFGIVYQAFDPKLLRQVALKVPRLHSMASKDLLTRFEREAQAAASLDHPNIVPVHEAGQDGPVCYIAAAYCSGPNLAEWLKARTAPVPARMATALVSKLAAAIQYSHSKGVLHRDLKPSNVLLEPVERPFGDIRQDKLPFVPRLTDFGLAKLLEADLEESSSHAETLSMGTPAYMAPEQTENREHSIGTATDVYGLGVILYELLTGRPPFQGRSVADLLDQICKSEPIAPCRIRREIPQDLETICLKCLEKTPARRFPTAQDLADELGRTLRGEQIVSRPVVPLRPVTAMVSKKAEWRPHSLAVSMSAAIAIVGLLAAHERSLAKLNLGSSR